MKRKIFERLIKSIAKMVIEEHKELWTGSHSFHDMSDEDQNSARYDDANIDQYIDYPGQDEEDQYDGEMKDYHKNPPFHQNKISKIEFPKMDDDNDEELDFSMVEGKKKNKPKLPKFIQDKLKKDKDKKEDPKKKKFSKK